LITGTGIGTSAAHAASRSCATQSVCRSAAARHKPARYVLFCATLSVALALFSPTSRAQQSSSKDSAATPAAYDTLLDEAVAAFDASDFSRARTLFERAYGLRPNSRVLRGMGIAALRLERYSEAYRALQASLKYPVQPLTESQKEEVIGLLTWMETSLACIKLRWTPSEPTDYEVQVDGKALHESSLWLAAGTHRVSVRAPGFGSIDRTLTLAPEQHEVIELTPHKREPAAVAKAPAVTPSDAAHSLPAPEPKPKPAVATRATGTRDEAVSDGGSVLTRWWFWTAVAAVAAGGVATAVLLSAPASTNPPDLSEGSVMVSFRK
jgi:hypothetical protein